MSKYSFEIFIEAASEDEANEKIKGAVILMQKLQGKEIKQLAYVVKNDPVKTALAKKYLGL